MRNGPYELVVAPQGFPGKKYRDRYCYEHVLVWWQRTGEIPGPDETIHHRNEKKRDNRFENLEKLRRGEHAVLHHLGTGVLIHGTLNGYQYHHCRCELCRAVNRDAQRRYRAKLRGSSIGS